MTSNDVFVQHGSISKKTAQTPLDGSQWEKNEKKPHQELERVERVGDTPWFPL